MFLRGKMMYLCTVINRQIRLNFNKINMIITEKEKSLAVFSSLFFRHYPELKEQLHGVMRSYPKAVGMVGHTKDYWNCQVNSHS